FKINRAGLEVTLETIQKFQKKLDNMLIDSKKALLVFAGSLPKGITKEIYKKLVLSFKRENTLICIDTDIFSKEDLIEISPFVIKPNNIELSHIAKKELKTLEEIKKEAKELSKYVTHVLVSLGKNGLLYTSENQVIHAKSPDVQVKSTVGAGDTTLAGFLFAVSLNKPIEEAVSFATACGTASVLLEGTAIINKTQANEMLKLIKFE
ncbi:MAG: PfkB family carbohydrate kinase, partial [Oscillospiraceae bacterium]